MLLVAAAPVAAAPRVGASSATLVVEEVRMSSGAIAPTSAQPVSSSPPPCSDKAYRTLGAKQPGTYKWSFKASSTPSSLTKATVAAKLQKSFNNVTSERNDCGRADKVSATSQYLGKTTRSPNCNAMDGHNVIGFAKLSSGILAVTCYWINNGKIVEADMRITTAESWALSMASCHGTQPLLEATITHEAGHVFGLGHVGEKRHGRLTMSTILDGPCENNEVTLGLGDMLGLESLY